MEISLSKSGEFKVKGKKAQVTILPDKIIIGDFVITGPGEYEVSGIDVIGLKDKIFRINVDDVSIGYLTRKLTDEEKNRVGTINIAIVASAANYDVGLEPAYVISLEPASGITPQPKLVTSADKLPETTTVVVLE